MCALKGTHYILEIKVSDKNNLLLNDTAALKVVILGATKAANTTVLESFFYKFSPYGVSGVVLLSESYLTIHTWLDCNYLIINIFTCGSLIDLDAAIAFLRLVLDVVSIKVKKLLESSRF